MKLLPKLPWWVLGLFAVGALILLFASRGLIEGAAGAVAALVGGFIMRSRANKTARRIQKDLQERLTLEHSAVDDLNNAQEQDLAEREAPVDDPVDDPDEEAARRRAVQDPWT